MTSTGAKVAFIACGAVALDTKSLIDAARTKGYGFARIQRYAIEHLLGVS